MSKTEIKMMPKQKDHAFGKDVYLLGKDRDGIKYWLKAASWYCGWYWGFGYVETYDRNLLPSKASGTDSHRHIDSSFLGKQEIYNYEKSCWQLGQYIHNLYDSHKLHYTTFNRAEGWKLTELFRQFYMLQEMASFCHKKRPGCHITESPVDHGDLSEWYKTITKTMMPKIFEEIYKILSP